MGMQCAVCGKKPVKGNQKTYRGKAKYLGGVGKKITGISKRVFNPNLQRIRVVGMLRKNLAVDGFRVGQAAGVLETTCGRNRLLDGDRLHLYLRFPSHQCRHIVRNAFLMFRANRGASVSGDVSIRSRRCARRFARRLESFARSTAIFTYFC